MIKQQDKQEKLRFPIYENRKLQYFWYVTQDANGAEICELNLEENSKKSAFILPTLHSINQNFTGKEYVEGVVKIKYDCFKQAQDIKKFRVVLPQNLSYRIERGEFTNNFCPGKEVTIVLQEGMKLYEVSRGSWYWLLAGDAQLGDSKIDGYKIGPVDTENLKNSYGYNIKVAYEIGQKREHAKEM